MYRSVAILLFIDDELRLMIFDILQTQSNKNF